MWSTALQYFSLYYVLLGSEKYGTKRHCSKFYPSLRSYQCHAGEKRIENYGGNIERINNE